MFYIVLQHFPLLNNHPKCLSGLTIKTISVFHLFIYFKIIQNLIMRGGGTDTTGLHVIAYFQLLQK